MNGRGIVSLVVLGVQDRTSKKGNTYKTATVLINGYTANIMVGDTADLSNVKLGQENELNIELSTFKGAINLKLV